MATLIDWSQVETKVTAYKDLYSCETTSIALAFVAIEHLLALTPDEIEDAITDGSKDRGIDAIVIREDGKKRIVHLFQVKHVEKFENAENNFPSSEVDKLLSFIQDLLSKQKGMEQNCNPVLWEKVREIWDAFDDGTPRFIVHLVGNMSAMVASEQLRLKQSLARWKIFDERHHTLESLATALLESNLPQIDRQIRLVDNQYFERIDGNIRGLIATVQAVDLVALIADPQAPERVLIDIFDDNVRVYLTQANRINAMIYQSALSESNAEFWYLNNGITMTCDSMSYPPGLRAPLLEMTNVQIVNGGQTSNALFEAFRADPERLKNVLILIRVYETKQREISLRIAESTNSQTPIRSRDLRANDQTQRKLASAFSDMGYYYERKARQFKDEDRAKRIDAQEAGQAYVAYFLGMPEVAGKDRGKIFGELYDTIYKEDEITAQRLVAAVQVYKDVERIKRKFQAALRNGDDFDPEMLFLIDGAYHLLFAISAISEQKGLDLLDAPKVCEQLNDAINVVTSAVKKEREVDNAYAHKKFFKSIRARKLIQRFVDKVALA